MDVSLAVPSRWVHSGATLSAATTASLSVFRSRRRSRRYPVPTGQTTLVHTRLDARDVMAAAAASDSGQKDEEMDSHSSEVLADDA